MRVLTTRTQTTTATSTEYRYADTAALTGLLVRQALHAPVTKRQHPREALTQDTITMLHMYRSRSASVHSQGQLVLPDAMKLVPLFMNSLFKLPAFRDKVDTRAEDAAVSQSALWRMPSGELLSVLYPSFYPLCGAPRSAGQRVLLSPRRADSDAAVYLPANVPAGAFRVTANQTYLVEVGNTLYIWIGAEVPCAWLQEAFGVSRFAEITEASLATAAERSEGAEPSLPERILAMIEELQARRAPGPPLVVRTVVPNTIEEAKLCTLLVEDAIMGEPSYVNYLCDIHAAIQKKLEAELSIW